MDAAGFESAPAYYRIFTESALPVELLYFTASSVQCSVELSWATASELNNDYFTLYRSTDFTNWEVVTKISGNGTSNQRHYYTYEDKASGDGIVYYKLVQRDYDGQEEQLPVKSLTPKGCSMAMTRIYPIPVSHILNIERRSSDISNEQIILSDATGKIIKQMGITENLTQIDVRTFPSGSYFVRIVNETDVLETRKILVIK